MSEDSPLNIQHAPQDHVLFPCFRTHPIHPSQSGYSYEWKTKPNMVPNVHMLWPVFPPNRGKKGTTIKHLDKIFSGQRNGKRRAKKSGEKDTEYLGIKAIKRKNLLSG